MYVGIEWYAMEIVTGILEKLLLVAENIDCRTLLDTQQTVCNRL